MLRLDLTHSSFLNMENISIFVPLYFISIILRVC
jgi:hypothetical protein